MKKLLIISSALIAFSAVNLFANDNSGNINGRAISANNHLAMDTVPKKDTSKKKTDSLTFQVKERK